MQDWENNFEEEGNQFSLFGLAKKEGSWREKNSPGGKVKEENEGKWKDNTSNVFFFEFFVLPILLETKKRRRKEVCSIFLIDLEGKEIDLNFPSR